MELGWSFPKRKKYLDELSQKKSDKTQLELFQGDQQYFSVHSIPIGLPKYRLDNGRTYAAQAKYIADNDLPLDFFAQDPELESAQKIQHAILKDMINEKGLLKLLKEEDQGAAIILDTNGFVINGNRRLCAWRELYNEDNKGYAKLSHIKAIILPPADPKDIDELEAHLQVKADVKAEYTWTSKALMLKNRQKDHGYNEQALSHLYEMSVNEIRELLDMLTYAEVYLEDRDKKGQYERVDKAEFAFRQLHKKREKLPDEGSKEAFEKIAYCLIDDAEGERLYKSIPEVADNLDSIVENISEEMNLSGNDGEVAAGIDLFGGGDIKINKSLLDALSDEKNYEAIRIIAQDVIEGERIKEKEKKKNNFVANQIRKAATSLIEASSAITPKTKKAGIDNQVASIEASLEKIKKWLKDDAKN